MINQELFSFIEKSPTAFHAIEAISEKLNENGYKELREEENWRLDKAGKYFVTRNSSSIIAFAIGENEDSYRFQITASHSDSPSFKLKENALIAGKDAYTRLNTEGYGGMLCSTWFDRALSLAGRVVLKRGNSLEIKNVNIDRDLLLIPSLAIHMNREANEKLSFNKQKDMLPLLSEAVPKEKIIRKLLAQELSIDEDDIYETELFLYNRTSPSVWGADNEFISAPRLDDLQCAFASLKGFLNSTNPNAVNVYACFDNEEVGSSTKQGAASTFLDDVLRRINEAFGKNNQDLSCALSESFMLSCDNAHALHPNYPEKADQTNSVYMNKGIVIKSHAAQKYTSDALSIAIFKSICEKADVPVQYFSNRSDMVGGSTLGNIAMTQVSLNCVDIGLAQLAMHSSYETAGARDTEYMIRACEEFYSGYLIKKGNKYDICK